MEIISGRNLACKDSQGGIERLWLFKYIKYSRSQITIENNILTAFPPTDIYEFEFVGDVGVTENVEEDDGGKYYGINFDIKIDNHIEIQKFLDFDFRAVALDRLGNYRLLGVWNGLTCTSINKNTGSNKSDYNGFILSFEGQELIESPYFYDISIITENSYLLQENGDFILQENGFKIIL
jgi:hypothetical protein